MDLHEASISAGYLARELVVANTMRACRVNISNHIQSEIDRHLRSIAKSLGYSVEKMREQEMA